MANILMAPHGWTEKPIVQWIKTAELIQGAGLVDSTHLSLWNKLSVLGSIDLLRLSVLGLFCSIRCPGRVVVELYDLARALRDAGVTVIAGFQTPMEKECLELLLRGVQPIIVCPARGIEAMRLPAAIKTGVDARRILLLSPFAGKHRRVTAELADERNRLVVALATEVLVAYAAPGGKTERLCRAIVATGKPVLTIDCSENANLLDLGAKPTSIEALVQRWSAAR